MRPFPFLFLVLLLFCSCTTLSGEDLKKKQNAEKEQINTEAEIIKRKTAARPGVPVHKANYASFTICDKNKYQKDTKWLDKRISLSILEPLSAKALVKMLTSHGLTITSNLPLEGYLYSGFGVKNVPVETALQVFFGSLGLDYEIDYELKTISIIPMPWKTFMVNIGNRSSSYVTGKGSVDGAAGESSDSDSTEEGAQYDTDTLSTGESISIEIKNDFWESIENSLSQRLKILVPKTSKSNGFDSVQGKDDDQLFKEVKIGRYALNPEVGSIQVQAPRQVLKEIEAYIEEINRKNNTQIHFQGKLYLVTADDVNNRGFDFSALKEIVSGYDFIVNNAAGNITISSNDDGIAQLTSGFAGNNGLFGIKSDSLQIFHAFLTENTNVAVLQEPMLTTSSGAPVKFQKFETIPYNSVSQTTSSGTGDAQVGTQNEIVFVQYGIKLSINPLYDPEKNIVRAQISWEQSLERGSRTINQYLNSDSGSIQEVPTVIPNILESTYSGEALLKDGDLIIIGGQKESLTSLSDQGTTGLKDTFLGPLLSKKRGVDTDVVFYFALQVKISKF